MHMNLVHSYTCIRTLFMNACKHKNSFTDQHIYTYTHKYNPTNTSTPMYKHTHRQTLNVTDTGAFTLNKVANNSERAIWAMTPTITNITLCDNSQI